MGRKDEYAEPAASVEICVVVRSLYSEREKRRTYLCMHVDLDVGLSCRLNIVAVACLWR